MEVKLYDYWRSSACYRVRIALNLTGIEYSAIPVDLLKGVHQSDTHLGRNPQGLVPALEIDGQMLTQSLAIIEYLGETRPGIRLLPEAPLERARARAMAHLIAMEIHPVCNLSVVSRVVEMAGGDEETRTQWMRQHIRRGLLAFERLLESSSHGEFCHGDSPGMADCCLVPQLYNALRWGADISDCHRIAAIARRCKDLDAFVNAHPDRMGPS